MFLIRTVENKIEVSASKKNGIEYWEAKKFDEFFNQYSLYNNMYEDTIFKGKLFAPYGKELNFVLDFSNKYIWSLTEEQDYEVIVPGLQFKNITGLFLSKEENTTTDLIYYKKRD